MKKVIHRILFSFCLLLLAFWILQQWLSLSVADNTAQVALLYTDLASYALNYDDVAQELTEQGIPAHAAVVEDWQGEAIQAITNGASFVIVGTDTAPENNDLLTCAKRYQASVIFVGHYPGEDYLASYDKAYFVGSRLEYASELAGEEMARAFKDQKITDRNENLLLDYLIAFDLPEHQLFSDTLEECEHHGAYVQNCFPPMLKPESDEDAVILPDTPTSWTDCTTAPEMILCGNFHDLEKAVAWVKEHEWQDVSYAAFMNHIEEVEKAADLGCSIMVYYDTKYISDTVAQLTQALIQHQSIVDTLHFASDETGAFWVPYQLRTDEQHTSDETAESSESSASTAPADMNAA